MEKTDEGPLPVIAPDGRQSWQVYAHLFDTADRRPRVAILIVGLGMSGAANQAAIDDLPGEVTLVFNPYASKLDDWIARARAAGHEVLLSLPMEPVEYPRVDPGPETLLTSLDAKQNLDRLRWVLTRVTGYVGVVSLRGSRFTTSKADLLPILDEIKARGLMFVDSRTTDQSVAAALSKSIGLPRAVSDIVLDQQASRDAIDQRLQQLESLARQNGVAVGITTDVYPVTIERVAAWIQGLDKKGIALAPLTAIANRQPEREAQQ